MVNNVQKIPAVDPVIEGNDGKARKSWLLFFQELLIGDAGTSFTPVATNLTSVGTPTLTGAYFQNQGFVDFWIKITPSTSTSAVAGSTYFDLPFSVDVDTGVFIAGGVSSIGAIDAANRRLFVPTWTGITTSITITGRVLSR